jgi:uncharacterized ferritin-like protein (DUF455 family)
VEARDFALGILQRPEIEWKLRPAPDGLTDLHPGPALRIESPARPPGLEIRSSSEAKVPPREGMSDPAQRPRILHALANHELQAVELFAWALLAFPQAPSDFRGGLLRILADEQRHTRWYLERLSAWGVRLGDHPVTGYFWSKAPALTTPIRFACAMGLTFENANLDHTLDYAEAARAAGDGETARLLQAVHADEVGHVRFGREWLARWKEPGQSLAAAYAANVAWPLRAALARGKRFHAGPRREAGLDDEFIRAIAEARREDVEEVD